METGRLEVLFGSYIEELAEGIVQGSPADTGGPAHILNSRRIGGIGVDYINVDRGTGLPIADLRC